MSKQPQPQGQGSPSAKSIRSRMGTIMRRSSTALSGFARPGTPSRSSTESLRLDANAGLEHVMPSPVAESPAREAAESMPEPTGPSKLSGPSITEPEPTPEPPATVSSSGAEQPLEDSSREASTSVVQPTLGPAPAAEVAPAPRSDAVNAPIPDSSSIANPVKSADPTSYVIHSPESLSRAASEHAVDEALPVRRSEDSASTGSHGQVVPPHERQLPTETIAAPWETGPLVAERSSQPEQDVPVAPSAIPARPNPVPTPTDRVSTPPIKADNSSVAGLALKSRTRGSTVSSQVRPRTPPIPNGRVSRRPSVSSLASSAAVFISHPVHAASTEPRQEGVVAPPASTREMEDPFSNPFENVRTAPSARPAEQPAMSMPVPSARNVWATAPVDVPLPPPSEVVYAMPIQTAPSDLSAAGKMSLFSPRELEYDTDESRPLLQPSTTSLRNPPNYGQTEPSRSVSIFAPQTEVPLWPVPTRRFASLGWQEFSLPDGALYFSNTTLHTVTDVDLRSAERLDAITTYLEGLDTEVLPPPEWELWLRDANASGSMTGFVPIKAWVHHGARMVLSERPSSDPGEIINKGVDKTHMEFQYWSFMVSHPAHALLPSESVSEAIDVLTWSYTDRLLPSPHPSLPPFSQEECQELLTLLRSFSHVSAQTVSIVRTRVVSKVLLRVAAWKQGLHWDGSTYQGPRKNTSTRVPFIRTAGDFIISFVCLGLPYLFLERSHHQRFDTESGVRSTAGPMLVVGALACLIAAIILSASVTFITLPGIDDISRVAGFLAILLSASSLISAVIALFRYKSDIENPIAYPRGEGLVLLSRRSVLLSLPLVFLLYAIAAFIAGIALYAFRGLTSSVGGRHFEDFTQWAVIGTVGGLACILMTSQTLIH